MTKINIRSTVLALLVTGIGGVQAQQATPALQGVKAEPLTALEFGQDMPDLAGKAMRMRRIDIAPGGSIGQHGHAGRPAVIYIIEGSIVEQRGEAAREYQAGESYSIGGDTSHMIENPNPIPATYIEVDIAPARN